MDCHVSGGVESPRNDDPLLTFKSDFNYDTVTNEPPDISS